MVGAMVARLALVAAAMASLTCRAGCAAPVTGPVASRGAFQGGIGLIQKRSSVIVGREDIFEQIEDEEETEEQDSLGAKPVTAGVGKLQPVPQPGTNATSVAPFRHKMHRGALAILVLAFCAIVYALRRSDRKLSVEREGRTGCRRPSAASRCPEGEELQANEIQGFVLDSMTYDTSGFSSWAVFHGYSHTIYHAKNLWGVTLNILAFTFLIACVEVLLVSDPTSLDPLQFATIGVFLNFFIAFLVGMFLKHGINNWWECIDGFLNTFKALRNLHMQLDSLEVERPKIERCLRYGILACRLLIYDLGRDALDTDTGYADKMWNALENDETLWKTSAEELEALKSVGNKPVMTYMWLSSFLGRMAQDGDIPPMESPTYGRIVSLVQDAQDGMRQVQSAVHVQIPFIYIHTLALLVQVNSLMATISFGLTLGVAIPALLAMYDARLRVYDVELKGTITCVEEVQAILIQFFQCFVGPFIFQVFLEIGVAISRPFDHKEYGDFPAGRLMLEMENLAALALDQEKLPMPTLDRD